MLQAKKEKKRNFGKLSHVALSAFTDFATLNGKKDCVWNPEKFKEKKMHSSLLLSVRVQVL